MALTEEQKAARAEKRRMANALKEEERAHRLEARRREWAESDMYLTREQAAAGELCRGCGLPVIDNLGDTPGLMYLTAEERVEHDAAEARYREQHAGCGEHRWSMSGSRSMHCGYCCPPIPFSESQLRDVARILMDSRPREEDLDTWERTLTCGHRMRRTAHPSNSQTSFLRTEHCDECGVTRGVVSSEKVIESAAKKREAQRKRDRELARAEREVAKAEKAARDARKKLEDLRSGNLR